jgi:hypothetical protein
LSLYCGRCFPSPRHTGGIPAGQAACQRCGSSDYLRCTTCDQLVDGDVDCPRCAPETHLARGREPEVVGLSLPELPGTSLAVPVVRPVVERYDAGRFGIKAEVTIPAGDVNRMNELGQLVSLLHVVAGHLAQFTGLTDHTRKLIRDMRVLATDAQEEIEMRRGPA